MSDVNRFAALRISRPSIAICKRKRTVSTKKRYKRQKRIVQGENGAPAFATTGIARLDLFGQGLLRNVPNDLIRSLMKASWSESAEQTVQIILHTRDIRKGKGERLSAIQALMWVREFKPKTFRANLDSFLSLGCFRDLLVLTKLVDEKKLPALAEKEAIELELFAHHLGQDQLKLNKFQESKESKESKECKETKRPLLSLAAKWAPSEGKHYSLIATRLAKLLFPRSKCPEKDYRRFLTNTRKHLRITETYLCTGRVKEIDFSSVPAICHKNLKAAFQKHAPKEYKAYKRALVTGEKKIKSTGIYPHELVTAIETGTEPEITEAQWRDMMANIKKETSPLQNAVALVDVSGSMGGEPMQVAVALGLVISDLTQGAYHNRVITFEENPQWHIISGDSLQAKVTNLKSAPWQGSTNLQAAFELILNVAQENKVPTEDMPSLLFILSDMQFNEATGTVETDKTWNENISKMYSDAGYRKPKIVFWNLRITDSLPIYHSETGVCLVSGFSPHTLKAILKNGVVDPLSTMLGSIADYPAVIDESERGL